MLRLNTVNKTYRLKMAIFQDSQNCQKKMRRMNCMKYTNCISICEIQTIIFDEIIDN